MSSLNPRGSLLARSAEHLFPHKIFKKLKKKVYWRFLARVLPIMS